jgi:hypothetical protein
MRATRSTAGLFQATGVKTVPVPAAEESPA